MTGLPAPRPVRPVRRVGLALAVAALLTVLCCTGGTVAVLFATVGGDGSTALGSALGCGLAGPVDPDGRLPGVGQLDPEQMRNAAIIIEVGAQRALPSRGWVIAVATALQESTLRNLPHLGDDNDHDSIGLFQQRPSQGWGTPEQLADPAYAAGAFFDRLVTVDGWPEMPLTLAAQAVQRSAYPHAYARHEPLATDVVNALADGAARAAAEAEAIRCAEPGEIAASGWTVPVPGPVVSAFRTPQRPAHHGADIAAAKGTPVRAASAGQVTTVRCNASRGGVPVSCDVDGSPAVVGCGWYVDILHADRVITRYCHLVSRPSVSAGQFVAAGAVIGAVGSSGNSSGPHLHFEVHVGGDAGPAGAVDPRPWMSDRGAPLGSPA
jgi:murein DD-endopeptidase MepM/ murein hydrolase activator NlpD